MPGPFWSYQYACVLLGSVKNVWMASPALDIDFKADLTPEDLIAYPVISQPTTSALSHLYDVWFAEQGLSVRRMLTCNSLGMMAQLTMLGLGISYLPEAYFAPLVRQNALRQLNVKPDLPIVNYYAVFKKSMVDPVVMKVVDAALVECSFDGGGASSRGCRANVGRLSRRVGGLAREAGAPVERRLVLVKSFASTLAGVQVNRNGQLDAAWRSPESRPLMSLDLHSPRDLTVARS